MCRTRSRDPVRLAAAGAVAGLAVLAGGSQLARGQTLAHRYSFNTDGAAEDSVGGANATLNGGATVAAGVLTTNGAAGGGANNVSATLPAASTAGITGSFAIEQYYTVAAAANFATLYNFGNSTADYLVATPFRGETGNPSSVDFNPPTGGSVILRGPNTPVGSLTHVVTTYETGTNTIRWYFNGALVASGTSTAVDLSNLGSARAGINGNAAFGDSSLNGSTDEFRIYSGGILSPSRVALDRTLPVNTLTSTANNFNQTNAGYINGANWSLNRTPDGASGDQGVIGNGGTANVDIGGLANNSAQTKITNGTLAVSTGTTFTPAGGIDLAPGSVGGATANLVINGGSTLNTPGLFVDGDYTSAGTSAKTITLDNGTLAFSIAATSAAAGLTAPNLSLVVGAGGATVNTNGLSVSTNAAVSGPGSFTKAGGGVLALTNGATTYAGTTTVNGGTIGFVAGAIPAGSGSTGITLNGGGLRYDGTNTIDLTANRSLVIGANGGTIDTQANNVTFASSFGNGNGAFTKAGAGTLTLTASNTYGGATNLAGGLINFANLNNLGNGSAINFIGGGLQFATGNTVDITTARTVTLGAGGGTVDTNGNNLSFAGTVAGANLGPFTKAGAGTLTFTSTMAPTSFFVRQGTFALDGAAAAVTTNNFISIGQLNGDNGTMVVRNGAKWTVAGDFNISDVSVSKGNLIVQDTGAQGTAVALRTLYVGKSGTSTGAVNQSGGTVGPNAAPSGDWRIGGGVSATDVNAVGTYDLSAGAFNTAQNFQIGAFGKGQLNQTGGTVTVSASFTAVGRFVGSVGQLNVSGGAFNFTSTGTQFAATEQGTGSVNVYGTGSLTTASNAGLNLSINGGTGQVNLGTGGTINAKLVFQGTAAGTSGTFNFHGGKLVAGSATTTFMQGLTNAYIWGEGGTIDTNANNITIAQNLLAPPAGNGVGTVSVPAGTGGAGYVAAPIVQFTRGAGDTTGVGATGVATINATGVVTGVTVTNPGTGYTAAPTVALLGGNPTTAAGAPAAALAATSSGGLTKAGTGTLTLTGASTYTGATTVAAGTLAVSLDGSIAASATINVQTGGTLDVSTVNPAAFTVGSGQTLKGTGTTNVGGKLLTVASGGRLAPGGSPGVLTITGTQTTPGAGTSTVNLASGATLDVQIDGPTVGTQYSQAAVTGTVDVTGSTLRAFTALSSFSGAGPFVIVNNDAADPVTGTFANPVTGGRIQFANGGSAVISYAGGDGNDIVLTNVTLVPEPASAGLLGLAAAGLLARRRRPRRG